MSDVAAHQDDPAHDVEGRRLRFCRELLMERRIMDRYIREISLSPASWIILLELYSAEAASKRLSVSSLGYASGVSIATAVRLTQSLEARAIVERQRDPHDARRTNVALSARGRATLRCIFDDCVANRAASPVWKN
ncbi:MAG: MarR family winged helix-turn-helix transcriptional regulator [Proteobacteria bacterium]|nr:MarR family winged helix-turn-helix transcriptional regulator [Pseudomonadota bacterium]